MITTKKSDPVKRIALSVHPIHEVAYDAVVQFKAAAESLGVEVVELGQNDADLSDIQCDLVASIGGDGTLLAAIRSAYPENIPVWGINVGDLGYLTISSVNDIEKCLGLLVDGDFWVEPRSMIEAVIGGKNKVLTAFNDIVVHRKVPGGNLIVLDVQLDGHFLGSYKADGLIISTPTGSTAYNLSAGGSILSPMLPAFIITPICAHSFSARSLVIDDSRVLVVNPMIKMPGDVILVSADGQDIALLENCKLHMEPDEAKGCEVIIRKAEQSVGLIRFEEIFFFDVLRDKLGWAEGRPDQRGK